MVETQKEREDTAPRLSVVLGRPCLSGCSHMLIHPADTSFFQLPPPTPASVDHALGSSLHYFVFLAQFSKFHVCITHAGGHAWRVSHREMFTVCLEALGQFSRLMNLCLLSIPHISNVYIIQYAHIIYIQC